MNLVAAVLAERPDLPPPAALGYEYVVAGNGLFVRASDDRMEALIPVASARLHGLVDVQPYARLRLPRLSARWLEAILVSARRHSPNEVLYQFCSDDDGGWHCSRPDQLANATLITYSDHGRAVLDVHSHHTMPAFFSSTDDADEGGLRFYAVVGDLAAARPEIALRAGVYGHHWPVPVETVFETAGPFVDTFGRIESALAPESL